MQLLHHLALAFGVDDVDAHRMCLLEPLHAVYRLYEVVELEADAAEHLAVAMPLEVAARAGQYGLGRKDAAFAVGKIDDAPLPLVKIKRTVDLHRIRYRPLDGAPLVFEVVPQDEMVAG